LISRKARKPPSKELVKLMMAKILFANNGKLGGRTLNLMKTAYAKAPKALRDSRSEWVVMEKELKANVENKDFRKWWDQTRDMKIRFKDHYKQCDRDRVAAADPDILELVMEQNLVLVLDKSNQLIAFCASKTLQKLFVDGVLDKVHDCFDIWT
jgi:hypothetical protein